MGAGTGVLTAAVAPLCRHVIAADVSPVMTYSWSFEAMLERVGLTILDRDCRRYACGTYTSARRST